MRGMGGAMASAPISIVLHVEQTVSSLGEMMKLITEHIIKSSQGVLFTGSYDSVIDWLYSNREYSLFAIESEYTHDMPSKQLIIYKVRK